MDGQIDDTKATVTGDGKRRRSPQDVAGMGGSAVCL